MNSRSLLHRTRPSLHPFLGRGSLAGELNDVEPGTVFKVEVQGFCLSLVDVGAFHLAVAVGATVSESEPRNGDDERPVASSFALEALL